MNKYFILDVNFFAKNSYIFGYYDTILLLQLLNREIILLNKRAFKKTLDNTIILGVIIYNYKRYVMVWKKYKASEEVIKYKIDIKSSPTGPSYTNDAQLLKNTQQDRKMS